MSPKCPRINRHSSGNRAFRTAFIKIKTLSKWLHEKKYLGENPTAKLASIKVSDELDPDHLTELLASDGKGIQVLLRSRRCLERVASPT